MTTREETLKQYEQLVKDAKNGQTSQAVQKAVEKGEEIRKEYRETVLRRMH